MITKSTFLAGLDCQTKIYYNHNTPHLKSEDEDMIVRMRTGTEIGKLARALYYGGEDLSKSPEGNNLTGEERTIMALTGNSRIVYEPTFISPDRKLKFLGDILLKTTRKWKLIEVKSTTKIKPLEHLLDIGFQYHVLLLKGIVKEFEFYIAHLDREYVLEDELDLAGLFKLEKVTTRARLIQPLIQRMLYQAGKTLSSKKPPPLEIGSHCMSPLKCEYFDTCWKGKPKYNVFEIGGISSGLATELYSKGIFAVQEIPRNMKRIKEKQWLEINSYMSGKPEVNKVAIKRFMSKIKNETLLYLDFESVMPAVPVFTGTRPYQQLCFQYCLLIQTPGKDEIIRKDFLAEPGFDPRLNFIERLLKDTDVPGKIIVYNKAFEESRLLEFAKLFPQYADEISERINRIVDLMEPFKEKHYYHPDFNGSYSLKVLSKIICPDINYDALQIRNGSMAMNAFIKMHTLSRTEQINMKNALLEYCFADVLCMLEIINEFKTIIK